MHAAIGVVALCVLLFVAAAPRGAAVPDVGAGPPPSLDSVLSRPGPALRSAVEALDAGEAVLADALLRATARRHPIIADHALLMRLRLRVESERWADTIALGEQWSESDSPLRGRVYGLLGQAYAATGQASKARSAWDAATRVLDDRERLAELQLRIGDSYEREGAHAAAAAAYLIVWTRYPELAASARAEPRLDAIERQTATPLRDARSYKRRGDTLYKRRRNEPALAAYDQALALGLSRSERVRAEQSRAETLFRLRRYPEAAKAYGALPRTERRTIQRARAHARAGDVPRGIRELEALARSSSSAQGTRALLLAALLSEGRAARELYAEVIRRAPRSGSAATARWWLAWDAYRDNRLTESIGYFEEIEARERNAVAALRPRYWRLRALEQQGDPDAGSHFAALAREFPLSYYGWRARARATADADATPRELPALPNGRSALHPSALARPRILLEAGLVPEAREELAPLSRLVRSLDDRLALAELYADAGAFDRAQRLVVDPYNERLARGPMPAHLELWWHAWPAPFGEEMRGATLEGLKIDPELVYSIMREESGYRPEVVSVSGARGLLQLMPATAERVARETQLEPFHADDLFLPSVNIQLGADYLTGLLRRFEGHASAAIGSYNAGPQAVARWVAKGPREDDVFVEEIPYGQTRGYVKRVLRSLEVYRVLY